MAYPTDLDTDSEIGGGSIPAAVEATNSPSHSSIHRLLGDAVQAIQSKLGYETSTAASGKVLTGTGSGTSGWTATPSGLTSVTATTFTGALVGNASTASSAAALTTAVDIGGVSFDGSGPINLPGVNTAGTQNTSGNAATASKLLATKTIGITGVTATATAFDGSANISIPITAVPSALLTDTIDTARIPTLSQYVRSDTSDTMVGDLTVEGDINVTDAGDQVVISADTDWALKVGNLAAAQNPDNKAVIGVVWDSAHGTGSSIGISLKYDASATTKTFLKFQYATGVDGGSVQSNGTTTYFVAPSDIRYKENVTPVSGALAALNDVDVISYNRIGHDLTRVGFSAQNVQSISEFARFVTVEEDDPDEKLQLAEAEFVPYLVSAVNELTARLEALEAV